jgi:hypothetical protein
MCGILGQVTVPIAADALAEFGSGRLLIVGHEGSVTCKVWDTLTAKEAAVLAQPHKERVSAVGMLESLQFTPYRSPT